MDLSNPDVGFPLFLLALFGFVIICGIIAVLLQFGEALKAKYQASAPHTTTTRKPLPETPVPAELTDVLEPEKRDGS